MKKIISIHQPNFLPWIPNFVKESCADVHVVLDHVEYSKNGWTNRAQYGSGKNQRYVTIPVLKQDGSKSIRDVRVSPEERSLQKVKKSLCSFSSKLPGSEMVRELSESIQLSSKEETYLIDINIDVHEKIRKMLGIDSNSIRSSAMEPLVDFKGSDLVKKIFEDLNGDIYLTGSGGLSYLESEFLKKCHVVSMKTIGIEEDEKNTIDFILKHGERSAERFFEICNSFERKVREL